MIQDNERSRDISHWLELLVFALLKKKKMCMNELHFHMLCKVVYVLGKATSVEEDNIRAQIC